MNTLLIVAGIVAVSLLGLFFLLPAIGAVLDYFWPDED